jgi:predicted RNA binding protein YcfA (HicA-like mRNA interferase family)
MSGEVRLGEVRRLLERAGWRLVRISGSHHIVLGDDRPPISVPVHHGKVSGVYVAKIEKAIRKLGRGPSPNGR